MKKITILLFSVFATQMVIGQVIISLALNPRPVANISNWAGRRDVLTLAVSPGAIGLPPSTKINTTIKSADGTTVAVTDMLRAQVKTLAPGTTNFFYASDVVDMQAMVFTGSYQNKLNRTGMLPAGNYQVIVYLVSVTTLAPISNTEAKIFFLSATQLPILIKPSEDAVLPAAAAQTAITFRWTALVPRPAEAVHYRVQVFEVAQGQTPMRALRSNQPLLDQEVIGTTQYIWRPMLSFANDRDNKFVWTIQSFDNKGDIITGETANGEGRSEPKIFIISSGHLKQ